MNIRVDLTTPIIDGTEVVFRSPVDCSQVTGLKVYYNGESKEFAFADAHGNNVGDIDHLFAENVVVKVILDVTTGMAFVQNADTNAYLEQRIDGVDLTLPQDLTPERKATVLENTGAARSDGAHGLRLGEDWNWEMDARTTVDIQPDWPEYEPGGDPCAGRIRLSQPHWSNPERDVPVVIGHVAAGRHDDDAATVGQVKDAAKFVRLAETVLTEDAVEIVWTQTQDEQPLSDYKDFFIFWTGKFTADVSTTHATNSRFQCKGNGGSMYFSCQFPKKISTENYAGWVSIEEITNDGNFAIWKSQFPNAFLRTGNGANIDYRVQGLIDACQTTVTDICCTTNPAHTTLQSLHLGNVAESTSIFAAGTKAVLYGRKR